MGKISDKIIRDSDVVYTDKSEIILNKNIFCNFLLEMFQLDISNEGSQNLYSQRNNEKFIPKLSTYPFYLKGSKIFYNLLKFT